MYISLLFINIHYFYLQLTIFQLRNNNKKARIFTLIVTHTYLKQENRCNCNSNSLI